MTLFAKVINRTTKECIIGTGTNAEFYRKIGMTEQSVEQCTWNNKWYLAGYVPEEPEEHAKQKRIEAIKSRLSELDAKSSRSMRAIISGTATEEDRQYLINNEAEAEQLRAELHELEG